MAIDSIEPVRELRSRRPRRASQGNRKTPQTPTWGLAPFCGDEEGGKDVGDAARGVVIDSRLAAVRFPSPPPSPRYRGAREVTGVSPTAPLPEGAGVSAAARPLTPRAPTPRDSAAS